MSSLFDEHLSGANNNNSVTAEQQSVTDESPVAASQYTASTIKNTVQELLKLGVLEAERKPNLYQTALTQSAAINHILEPFDLALKIDDIRGLVMLVVAQTFVGEDDNDEWSHPLVRRQRLTLEQSLLIAILRQVYVLHEQEQGIGAGGALLHLDDLIPQLQLYLGDLGSDAREQKRLRNLLDNLKTHGVVADIDEQDQVLIRPIITHLADPASLTNLLQHFRARSHAHQAVNLAEHDE